MATLITQHGAGGGEHGRRCDARCHHAKKAVCACICGGRYHGCSTATGYDPRSIEDAELQAQGIDPRMVSAEAKAEVSSAVLSKLTGQDLKVKFERGRFQIRELNENPGGLSTSGPAALGMAEPERG